MTDERLTLPGDIGGWLEGRSRFARLGIMIHVTSGFVQPGVASRQVLEMSNVSGRTLSNMTTLMEKAKNGDDPEMVRMVALGRPQ